jgi:predicted metal-dependent hydrolase
MVQHIHLGKLEVEVEQKSIKNIHLSVYPPQGRVRVAAPLHYELDTIRIYVNSKLTWIRKEQVKMQNQERENPRLFMTQESHYFEGKRYLMEVIESNETPKVILHHSKIELCIRPNTSIEQRQILLNEWYRKALKIRVAELIEKWETILGVSINQFGIKRMKTKWGTCNIEAKRIWINLELAKKPLHCLEYIVVHEMIHLIERHHNARFIAYLDKHLSQWRSIKEELNRLAIGYF